MKKDSWEDLIKVGTRPLRSSWSNTCQGEYNTKNSNNNNNNNNIGIIIINPLHLADSTCF